MKNEQTTILISDAIKRDNQVWFITKNYNGLYCLDLNTTKIELKGLFPKEKYYQEYLYIQMKLYDNKIIVVPHFGSAIIVYDIFKNQFYRIEVEKNIWEPNKQKRLFIGSKIYKNYLFLLPAYSKAIIRLNINTLELIYLSDWLNLIQDVIIDVNEFYFSRQAIIKANKLFAPLCNANAILELDCDSLKSRIHKIGQERYGYIGICCDKDNFCMPSYPYGKLIKWNVNTNEKKEISIEQSNSEKIKNGCIGVAYYNEKINVFPYYDNKIEFIQIQNNITVRAGQFLFIKEEDDTILYYEVKTGCLTIIDTKKDDEKVIKIVSDKSVFKIKEIFEEHEVITENKEIDLLNIISYLKTEQ